MENNPVTSAVLYSLLAMTETRWASWRQLSLLAAQVSLAITEAAYSAD